MKSEFRAAARDDSHDDRSQHSIDLTHLQISRLVQVLPDRRGRAAALSVLSFRPLAATGATLVAVATAAAEAEEVGAAAGASATVGGADRP